MTQIQALDNYSLVSGIDMNGRPLLAVAGKNKWGQLGTGDQTDRNLFTPVKIPPQFSEINEIILTTWWAYILGRDEKNRFILARSGKNVSTMCEAGDQFQDYAFNLIKLPEQFSCVTQVQALSMELFILGKDELGTPLLAVAGSNHLGRLGLGNIENSFDKLRLVSLPKNFKELTQIITSGCETIIVGIDGDGRKIFAVSGYNRYDQLCVGDGRDKNVFTVISLPECLELQKEQARGCTIC